MILAEKPVVPLFQCHLGVRSKSPRSEIIVLQNCTKTCHLQTKKFWKPIASGEGKRLPTTQPIGTSILAPASPERSRFSECSRWQPQSSHSRHQSYSPARDIREQAIADGRKWCYCCQRLMHLSARRSAWPMWQRTTDKLLAIPRRLYLRIKRKRRNYFITARQDLSNRTSGEASTWRWWRRRAAARRM